MVEDGIDALGRSTGTGDEHGSWFAAVKRMARAAKGPNAREAMAEAAEALERLTRASQALLDTVSGEVLPSLDGMVTRAETLAGDRRVAASVRSRVAALKADTEAVRATLSALTGGPQAAEAPAVEPLAIEAPSLDTGAGPSGPLRILAAEANGAHQLQLRAALAQIGVTPQIVADGAALIDAWREEPWDVILLDVQSDAIGGPAAARMIRAGEAKTGWTRTPIVALGLDPLAPRRRAEDAIEDFDAVVAKPLSGPAVIGAIEQTLADRDAAEPGLAWG